MSCCHRHRNAVIRNQKSGMVLDAANNIIRLQHFTGCPSQLWQFEEICPGKYYIVNQCSRKVLDIEGGVHNGHNLITYEQNGGSNQQWYINSDATIVSAGGDLAVDICRERYIAGNNLIAFHRHGKANQQFHIQHL